MLQTICGWMPVYLCGLCLNYPEERVRERHKRALFFFSLLVIHKFRFSTPLTDTPTTPSSIITSSYWGCGATPESHMNKYRHIKIQQAYLQYVLLLFPGKRCLIQLDTGVPIYTMIVNTHT